MGKSIRSKRQKRLRTLKRQALAPLEQLKVALDADTLPVKRLHAKLNADILKQQEESSGIKPEERMKDESSAAPVPDVQALLIAAPTAHRFVHSHPKPRDPADPTVRPWPRGRPRGEKLIAASSLSFRSALHREQEAMQVEEDEEKKSDTAAAAAEEKLAEGKQADDEVQEVRGRRALRSRAAKAGSKADSSSSLSMISMLDSDDERDDSRVSYGSLGRPARRRRNKLSSTSIHNSSRRSGSKRRGGRLSGLLANWHRIPGHGEN